MEKLNSRKLMSLSSFVLLIGSSLMLSACNTEETASENIRTQGIWARMVVESKSNGNAKVDVELNSGGANGTNIVLSPGDRLEATVNGVTKVLQEDNDFLDVDYETSFSNVPDGAPFRIAFIRSSGASATNSSVTLPDSFSINSPQNNASFQRNANISLNWSPNVSGATIEVNQTYSCANNDGGTFSELSSNEINDTGSLLIQLANVTTLSAENVDKTKSCTLGISLVRQSQGSLDAGFTEGGSIAGEQIRQVQDIQIAAE